MIEYGIAHHRTPDELHRGPMTKEQALEWLREWDEDGGTRGTFILLSRAVGDWRVAPEQP